MRLVREVLALNRVICAIVSIRRMSAERVKAAGITNVVVGEAILREDDPAKTAEALLL